MDRSSLAVLISVIFIPITISGIYYQKSVYDANNSWEYNNNCKIIRSDIKKHTSMGRYTYKINTQYYLEIILEYIVKNSTIKSQINLNATSEFPVVNRESENYKNNIIIPCYYMKNYPKVSSIVKPGFNNDALIIFKFFSCVVPFILTIQMFSNHYLIYS